LFGGLRAAGGGGGGGGGGGRGGGRGGRRREREGGGVKGTRGGGKGGGGGGAASAEGIGERARSEARNLWLEFHLLHHVMFLNLGSSRNVGCRRGFLRFAPCNVWYLQTFF
jgi:hypothetical protein